MHWCDHETQAVRALFYGLPFFGMYLLYGKQAVRNLKNRLRRKPNNSVTA